ncbi:MAG: M67 family metallopeptidase [Acidobacteriia bacterium]|nr:M67 family metallopeptidase [Terriglobia bacterium]
MTLRLTRQAISEIKAHGRETYPHECCGALVGTLEETGRKIVHEVVRLPNSYTTEVAVDLGILENERGTLNRYIIDPKDLYQTEKEARAQGWSIVGFYHSHPDHPAVPSKYDLGVASSGYSYVIVSVPQGIPAELRSWQTDAPREEFLPEVVEEA